MLALFCHIPYRRPSPISLQPSKTEETEKKILHLQHPIHHYNIHDHHQSGNIHQLKTSPIEVTSPTHTRTKCKCKGKALRNGDPSDKRSAIRSTHTTTKHFVHTHTHTYTGHHPRQKAGSSVTSLQTHSLEYVVAASSEEVKKTRLISHLQVQCGWLLALSLATK